VGGALGDSLGAPVEFLDWDTIRQKYGEHGVCDLDFAYGKRGAVTDDTQMTLFTVDGLCQFFLAQTRIPLEIMLTQAYLFWLETQDGVFDEKHSIGLLLNKELWSQRAPGNTCLGSLRQIKQRGTVINNQSDGCGGVMRVAPVGLAVDDPDEAYCTGKMCALVTHQGINGFVSAGALARIISLVAHKGKTLDEAQLDTYEFVKREESECRTLSLWKKLQYYNENDSKFDHGHMCELGQGWTGDEALMISLYCALKEQDTLAAIVRAVNHSGDSDSTGSITGQIMGTINGVSTLPTTMLRNLELYSVIMEKAESLHSLYNIHNG